MAGLNVVLGVNDLVCDYDLLFTRLTDRGIDPETVLFADTQDLPFSEKQSDHPVPDEVRDAVGGNLELCILGYRGWGAMDSILGDPKPGTVILMYDCNRLNHFTPVNFPENRREDAIEWYAATPRDKDAAFIGALHLV